ncbi:hypothetical protein ACWGI8_42570 [Streptomyces sp. NPDC054841]
MIPALLLVAACGQQTTPGRVVPSSTSPQQHYKVRATVLENSSHGPQLCWAVLTSLPPQCSGPDVVGWTWKSVKRESRHGTIWGSYDLTGTWDGTRFTLTEPARSRASDAREIPEDDSREPDFSAPCPAPAGGRKPVDRSKADVEDYERALQLAEKDPEFGGGWIDSRTGGDGAGTVLVMRFTRDLTGHEREIRKVWGGPLCLTTAAHSQAELRKVRDQAVKELPRALEASVDVVRNAVNIRTVVATDDVQRDMDRRFGAGVVHIRGWLQPVG